MFFLDLGIEYLQNRLPVFGVNRRGRAAEGLKLDIELASVLDPDLIEPDSTLRALPIVSLCIGHWDSCTTGSSDQRRFQQQTL